MKLLITAVMFALLSACAATTVPTYDLVDLEYYDEDTEYAIVPFDGGYDVSIAYSKYNFVHNAENHRTQCANKIVAIAKEFAEAASRPLDMPNVRRITFYNDRDTWTGVNTCRGNLTLNYSAES